MLWLDLRKARSAKTTERLDAASRLAGSTDPRAIACLTSLLDDVNDLVQRAALDALSVTPGPHVVPTLIAATRKKDQRLVQKACESLAARRDPRAVPPLEEVAAGTRAWCWKAAIRALLALGWSPKTRRERAQVAVCQGAWPPSLPPGNDDLERVLQLVRDETADASGLADECVALFVAAGGTAVPILRTAVAAGSQRHEMNPGDRSPDPTRPIRKLAMRALAAIEDRGASDALYSLAAEGRTAEEDDVYAEALVAKGAKSIAVIERILERGAQPGSRPPTAREQLLWVRALSRLADERGIRPLARLHFESADRSVRAAAEVALRAIDPAWPQSNGCRELVPGYIGILRSLQKPFIDEDPGAMDWNAVKALEAMSGESFGFDAGRWQAWWDEERGGA
jgi:HEAT repeat protein